MCSHALRSASQEVRECPGEPAGSYSTSTWGSRSPPSCPSLSPTGRRWDTWRGGEGRSCTGHGGDGRDIYRWKITDPSFHNWRALTVAVRNNIVPDFPVINKSFNLSYSGNDR